MWINKTKYELEKQKYKQRINYLENLICPCESHDYVEIDYIPPDEYGTVVNILKCKRCGKIKEELG